MAVDSYRGLAVEVYDRWVQGRVGDEAYFRAAVEAGGGPALEVACGTGRLLAQLCHAGLPVDGVDLSPAMLARCRAHVAGAPYTPQLTEQAMQALDLERRYHTIFVPFRSFLLVPDRGEALDTLRRFNAHLVPGGQVIISMFVPDYANMLRETGEFQAQIRLPLPDGAEILVSGAARNDLLSQTKEAFFRYEQYRDGLLERTELQTFQMRWYSPWEFELMLFLAGFVDVRITGDFTDQPLGHHHREMVFLARRPA